ncbi:MAG: hypothetical protein AB1411_09855 [Nitrospirota bacterium]
MATIEKPGSDDVLRLCAEFRRHLEVFYARLKLAPPYHSVEKAVARLSATLNGLPPTERARLAADPALKWSRFRDAFVESGLHQKHRGIIAGLARSGRADLPADYRSLLEAFLS